MKFLCLPGIGIREQSFLDLMKPVFQAIESKYGDVTFRVATGTHELQNIPSGFLVDTDEPPYPSYFPELYFHQTQAMFRESRRSEAPEDFSRRIFTMSNPALRESISDNISLLNKIIDEEGPFDGLIGHSQGGQLAAMLLADRLNQCSADYATTDFRCAIFLKSLPPLLANGTGPILADLHGKPFHLPTCHVIGHDDPVLGACISLYNLCNPRNRVLVEAGNNHMISWDKRNREEVPKAICKFLSTVFKE